MRIPIVSGITASETADFTTSYPLNREPVLRDLGLSEGYLGAPSGITLKNATGLGVDRGGINWNGVCYRVIGSWLARVNADWTVDYLGDVGTGGPCALDYSFDNLIVNSGTDLFYWNATDGFRQVTDPDLGTVIDAIFVDGYTMTTDGTSLVVTDLNDPMAVNPLKYGSSEESPDAVTGLIHMHGEVYALNRYTIQVFQNIGGAGFPFETVKTATVPYGCIAPRAKCKFVGSVAFVGGPDNGDPGVFLLGAGDATRISPSELDDELAAADPADVWLEAREAHGDQRLYVHLPTKTWGFSTQVSRKSSVRTWCQYVSDTGRYEGRGMVPCYGEWIVGSQTGQIGVLDASTALHYGAAVPWQFDTPLVFNDTAKGLLTEIVLTGAPGRGGEGAVFFSYTKDGETWSVERSASTGRLGERTKRVTWRPGIRFEQYMGLRFRGLDSSLFGIARLDCKIDPLNG